MTSAKYAPANDEGLLPYVQTRKEWAGSVVHHRIVRAANLTAAKQKYGWTRERHTSITVRRATPADIAEYPEDPA